MKQTPDLWTTCITCTPAAAERIADTFEEDALAVSIVAPPRQSEATVEVLTDGRPDEEALAARLAPFSADILRHACEAVGNLDWIKKVSGDFPPLPIARWTIFGAAHKDKITDFTYALQIDATSAFGTGEHPTTRGCLLLLDELLTQNPDSQTWNLLDMGCGSGILAMAFAKATQGQALGIDMDEHSIEIANENADINGVTARTNLICGMGYEPAEVQAHAPYDLIMANIFAEPLCEMAADLKNHLKPGGWAILSGLLQEQEANVLAAHEKQGLELVKRLHLGEWSALALKRSVGAS